MEIDGPLPMRANLEAFQKISKYCNNISIDRFIDRIYYAVHGLSLQESISRDDKKAKESKFLMKIYYNFQKNWSEKYYNKSLKRVNDYLKSPGLAKETTLAYLDSVEKNANWKLPKEIADKIRDIPRIPFTESRIKYLMRTDSLVKSFIGF